MAHTVTDNQDGTYALALSGSVAGSYTVAISRAGSQIGGGSGPASVIITPAAIAPSACVIETGELYSLVAGNTAKMVVTVKDAFGNPRLAADDSAQLAVTYTGPTLLGTTAPVVSRTGPATYEIALRPQTASPFALALSIAGTQIFADTSVAVSPAAASASGSLLETPFQTLVAGVLGKIRVLSKDVYGNEARFSDQDIFTARFTSQVTSTDEPVTVAYAGNSRYELSISPKTAGAHSLEVKLNGVALANMPVSFTVDGGATSARNCEVTALSTTAVAGQAELVSLKTKDVHGNVVSHAGDAFVLVISGQESKSIPFVWLGAGPNYEAIYTPQKSGTLVLQITHKADVVYAPGTLPTVSVQSSPVVSPELSGVSSKASAAAATTTASSAVVAGTTANFVVTPRDIFGNSMSDRTLVVAAQSSGFTWSATRSVNGVTYALSGTPTKSGGANASVTISGVELRSRYAFAVTPNATKAATTVLNGDSSTTLVAGTARTFTFTAKDAFGNDARTVDPGFTAAVAGASSSASLRYLGNGRYSVSVIFRQVGGVNTFSVLYNGVHVMNSPVTISNVVAAASDAGTTTAQGTGLTAAVAGVQGEFTVSARDAFSNPTTNHVDVVEWQIVQPSSSAISASTKRSGRAVSLGGAQYAVRYNLTEAGEHVLHVTLNGISIFTSSSVVPKITVSPAAADLQQSDVMEQAKQTVAGVVVNSKVIIRDAFGNQITLPPASGVSYALAGRALVALTSPMAWDAALHAYRVAVEPTLSGAYSGVLTIDSVR